MFTLRLFGGLRVEGPDGPLAGRAAQRRRLAILAVLAAAPGRVLSRDKLIGYIWPETETEQARHLLAVSIHELRKAIDEEAILSVGDDLRLDPDRVRTDLDDFDQAMGAGDYERAVEAYAGPFLDGFFVSDAPDLERWIEVQREQYRNAFLDALEKLALSRTERGDRTGAVQAWRRLAAEDPYSTRVALGLMRALDAADDRAGALQHARVHEVLLREEFGTGPDPEVDALAERIRSEPRPAGEATHTADATATAPQATAGSEPAVLSMAEREPAAMGAPPHARPWRKSYAWLAAVVIVLIGVTGYAVQLVIGNNSEPSAPSRRAIAVLPFQNVSPDQSNEYFSDGLTEEIINALSAIEDLDVTARTSAFAFKGQNLDVRTVGDRLNVGSVLEGSVRKAGEQLRITVRLVDVENGYELWHETYDRRMGDVFAIQEHIARAVVEALEVELGTGETAALVRTTTEDPEAYNLYLRGRHAWYQRDPEGFRQAIHYFQQAIEQDSGYALAYAGLADVYTTLGSFEYGALAPELAYPRAREAALRALEIDPDLAEAHTALATVLFSYDWDWQGAEREFLRAIELNPGYATAHHHYSLYLLAMGRMEESRAAMRRAREMDPLSAIMSAALARNLYFSRQFEPSVTEYRRAIELDSTLVTAYLGLGLSQVQAGEPEEAIRTHERGLEVLREPQPVGLALLAHADAVAGRDTEARDLLERLEADAARRYVPAEYLAIIHLGLGEPDAALAWLERSYENHSNAMAYLTVEPILDPLRSNPRFQRLVGQVGLPEEGS